MNDYVVFGLFLCVGVLIGACVPKVTAYVQREFVQVKADAVIQVAQAKAELQAVKLKAESDVAALTTRAETAEAFIARFLPVQQAQPGSSVPAPVFSAVQPIQVVPAMTPPVNQEPDPQVVRAPQPPVV